MHSGDSELANVINTVCEKEKFKFVKIFNYTNNEFDKTVYKVFKEFDFVIVDAHKWSPYHLEIINKIAVELNKPWLYVSGINEISIEVGPLFHGKETGCYNCLIARLKSNNGNPQHLTSYEDHLRDAKIASASIEMPHDNILYALIANFAVYEVIKFIEEWALPVTWQSIVKFNLYNYSSSVHTLLKKPLCNVCKPKLTYNPSPWLDKITLK